MRYLDLVIAGLIGTSSLAGMVALNPIQGDVASSSLATESQLRDELLALLQQRGTVWLIQSSPETVCSYLRGMSNSSVTFSGEIGQLSCGAPPSNGVPTATIVLHFTGFQVVLEAWPNEQA